MSILENFLTWDVLLTYSGCVAGTVLLTEFVKKLWAKAPAQLISFLIATAILAVGHLATGTFSWTEAPLYLLNAVAVSLASNGGFDILKKAFAKDAVVTDQLVIDKNDPINGDGTYLSLSRDIEDYTDGEVVSFKVKKV